ncbi:MAG: glycosyltransferase family 4 protein [Candidatus Aenigmarchaeota archaeon]|nr:glycosyltransferase family 4 protein [Candidatus Aenigmarchaeota archaeon]
MKTLMLNYEFPPLGGGGSNACKYILKEMAKKGVSIDLVTSSASNHFETETIGETIKIYRLPVNKKSIHFWTQREVLSYSMKSRSLIKKLLKQEKYNLCHAFFGIPCGAIAYLFKKRLPYIVSLRGSDVPGFNNRFELQYVFLKPFIKKIWRNARAVIANSEGLKQLAFCTDAKQKIGVIPNGIDMMEFKPGKNTGKLKILCVSRLIRRKGIDYLIKSIPLLEKQLKDFEIVIIGEGNQEIELKRLSRNLGVEKFINFEGYVPHDNLPEIYSKSDVFVLPSLNEGMSNTVLEAMASGLPIITTDTGGTNELMKDNGVIVPPKNEQAISEAIVKISNESIRKDMGKKSREIVKQFDWGTVAERYIDIYRGI